MRLVNHHYDMSKINIAFLLGGLLLLGTWAWAVYDDYNKPYKQYQRTYYDVYSEQLKFEKKSQWTESKQQTLQQKKQEIQQKRSKIDARGSEVDQLRKKLDRLNRLKFPKVDKKVKTINSELTPIEYEYQKEVVKAEEDDDYQVPAELEKRYKELKAKYESAAEERARVREEIGNVEQKIDEKQSSINQLESEVRELTQRKQVIESTLDRIDESPLNRFLDAPMVNFVQPRIDIRQYQVSGMYLNYNFDMINRRDYCKSCHMGIDNPAFKLDEDGEFEKESTRQAFQKSFPGEEKRERYKEVFKAHPRFELIGPSNAKYPFSEYGCTGCHMGDGRALGFKRAAHTPDNKKEKEEWEELYNWEPREYFGEKMLKSQFYDAGFRQFYQYGTKVNIPHADELNEGRELWRQNGCNNCHAVEGMNYQRKVGFSLEHVASKLDKNWVKRWVEMPTDFDPTTNMPQVFHRTNIDDEPNKERSTAVIESITTYLYEKSRPVDLNEPPAVPGNVEQGEKLVKELGCFGCHSMVEEGVKANMQAPDLSNVGEKIKSRKWLYTWLRNPAKIWSKTHMPSMKLSKQEANDITSYLMEQKKDDWDADNFPTKLDKDISLSKVVDKRLDDVAKQFLGRTRGPSATEKKLAQIKSEGPGSDVSEQKAVKLFVGEQAVEHFGCASCHAIPGNMDKNRIGANLTGWANKSTHKLAFNFIHIPHTRQDYLMTKLRNTGIFDRGLDKTYLEKYRMPKFNLTEKERQKIVTHVMSLKAKDRVDESKQFQVSSSEKIAYEGRKLVNEYNCQGCHTLDEQSSFTGYLRDYYQNQIDAGESFSLGNNTDPSARQMAQAHVPPTLTNVGNRLTEDWIFNFLKKPVGPNGRNRIRTWQHVRMPQFQFTDEEASTIAQGLAHEGWNKMPPKVSAEEKKTMPDKKRVGRAIYSKVCANCHIIEGNKTFKAPQMTPNLNYIRNKFHYEGFIDWIEKPSERFVPASADLYRHQGMVPYSKLPMNESFLGFEPEGDYSTKEKQMKALRDYIFNPE